MLRTCLLVCLAGLPSLGGAKTLLLPVHLSPEEPAIVQALPKSAVVPLAGVPSNWDGFHEGYAEGPNAQLCQTLADLPPGGTLWLNKALGQDLCAES